MNPILLPIAELKPALVGLGKVINNRAALPVLQHIKIERDSDGWIALTATDLENFVSVRLEQPSDGPPMTSLIPYDQLTQLAKNCGKDENLFVDSSPLGTFIRFSLVDSLSAQRVKLLSLEEFPPTPIIKSDPVVLSSQLRDSIHEAMECASTNMTRPVLHGAFIDTTNPKAHHIVATDGKHLYSANSFALPLERSLIIPNHKFLGWREFNNDGEWQIQTNPTHLQISSRRWSFITNLIEGNYPNWRQVLPDQANATTRIILDPDKLEAIIKIIQRLPNHDELLFTIGLEYKQGQIRFLAKAAEEEQWMRIPIPDAKAEGEEQCIYLNRKVLLKAFGFGFNKISITDPKSPALISRMGKLILAMPINNAPPKDEPSVNANTTQPRPVPPPPPLPPLPQPPTTQERTPVNNEPPTPNEPKSAIDEAIDLALQIRDKFNDGINQMRDLSGKLKLIKSEQKTSSKEFSTIRSTLRTLQTLKL